MYATLDQWIGRDVQETSTAAYKIIKKINLNTLYGKIVQLLEAHPDGLSIGEIASLLGMQKSTISARINELRKKGVLKFHEERSSSESGLRNMMFILCSNYKDYIENSNRNTGLIGVEKGVEF